MALSEMLLPEFDQEMASTRKTLARVPAEKFGWKPHEKSMSMGDLASHIAHIPFWAVKTLEVESLDLAPEGQPPVKNPSATSSEELLGWFDKNVEDARQALAQATDEHFLVQWSLLMTGKTIFTLPRIAVFRTMVLSHLIHHRAQLGVYLRLNDIAVPSVYGPSADEGMM